MGTAADAVGWGWVDLAHPETFFSINFFHHHLLSSSRPTRRCTRRVAVRLVGGGLYSLFARRGWAEVAIQLLRNAARHSPWAASLLYLYNQLDPTLVKYVASFYAGQ